LPLTLREEHRLRVFENRVLRRIFGPKWDEVTGDYHLLGDKPHDVISQKMIIIIVTAVETSNLT
jgi:hypothetical protein